MISRSEAGRM